MVPLTFAKGGFVNAEDNDFKIEAAQFEVDPVTKRDTYIFKLISKTGAVPRSIRVEDVSDEAPVTWVEDAAPKLTDRRWVWRSDPVPADRANLRWVFEIESCFRVCRFTIVAADGRTVVLHQPCSYPDFVKAFFRQQLGLEQAPAPR